MKYHFFSAILSLILATAAVTADDVTHMNQLKQENMNSLERVEAQERDLPSDISPRIRGAQTKPKPAPAESDPSLGKDKVCVKYGWSKKFCKANKCCSWHKIPGAKTPNCYRKTIRSKTCDQFEAELFPMDEYDENNEFEDELFPMDEYEEDEEDEEDSLGQIGDAYELVE
eukprot:CAMPEP_0196805658 /NCGR_PEP_ID=MMETSP1362-20130617/5457_1 /TAXON_ID=163516 /ORGANISM="Leptocylindrus danicus, Strain CCMP1856" /LENGTH=170 /DNA_ID=CAMNT_0042178713 /DNA_START=13 /DNA_END=525 /DNA_ORIENTATION=-